MEIDWTSMPLSDLPVTSVSSKATPKQIKKSTKKHKNQAKASTSSKRRRTSFASASPVTSSPLLSPQKIDTTNAEEATGLQLSTVEHDSSDLQSAINTIQIHLSSLDTLRAQNSQLQQEKAQLKQQVDDKDAFIWELKEYNENLQARVTELDSQCDVLRAKLQKIRRLSGVNVLEEKGDSE